MGQKNVFYAILEQKNNLLRYNKKKFKKSKNWDFSKRLNPCSWSNNDHISNFFLGNIGQKKCVLRYARTKKTAFYAITTRSSNSRKIKIVVQKWPFFQFFFLGNIGQENVFYDILELKNDFLGYKNNKFKKSKNWDFSKGVNPWFWFKNGLFFHLFF